MSEAMPKEWQDYEDRRQAGWIDSWPRQFQDARTEYEEWLAFNDNPLDINPASWLSRQLNRERELLLLGVCVWPGTTIWQREEVWILSYYTAAPSPIFAPSSPMVILEDRSFSTYHRGFLAIMVTSGRKKKKEG